MNKKGQNISEYAIVIGLLGSALLMMSVYFQRGIQSVIKAPVDNLGGFGTGLFSPERIQEIGIEENSAEPGYGTNPVFESTASFSATKRITTSTGGERKTDNIAESTNVSKIQRSYQEIKYDQVE